VPRAGGSTVRPSRATSRTGINLAGRGARLPRGRVHPGIRPGSPWSAERRATTGRSSRTCWRPSTRSECSNKTSRNSILLQDEHQQNTLERRANDCQVLVEDLQGDRGAAHEAGERCRRPSRRGAVGSWRTCPTCRTSACSTTASRDNSEGTTLEGEMRQPRSTWPTDREGCGARDSS